MTGARISYALDDKAFTTAVTRLGGVLGTGVLRAIGTALVEETNKRFESGRDPFSQPWAELLPAYAMIKRGPGILRESRMLQRSITYQVSGSSIYVGSNRIYAAVHQFGAVIKAKNAPALSFRLGFAGPKGGVKRAFVHVQSVTIPQRPYLGFGPNDQAAVMGVLRIFVSRAFRG